MISAIAARKARQQANPESTLEISSASPSPVPTQASSKRKPVEASSDDSKSPKKKAKKVWTSRPKPSIRYFAAGAEAEEDAVVVPDSDESSDEEVVEILPPGQNLSKGGASARRRQYSPSAPVYDSSGDDSIHGDDSEAFPVPLPHHAPRVTTALSTFQPVIDQNVFLLTPKEQERLNVATDTSVALLSLPPGTTAAFIGVYTLTVIRGIVSILGTPLSSSRRPHHVFATKSSPIPVIRAESASDIAGLDLPDRLRSVVNADTTLVVIAEFKTNVEKLGLVCRTFEGVFESVSQGSALGRLEGIHFVTESKKDVQPFAMPSSWECELSSLKEDVYIVKGPKRVGKSTFSRTLVNRLLKNHEKVAYLECDLGQSEFTPGGLVALNIVNSPLFGPPFTHPSTPYYGHFVGSTTPQNSPSLYISAIQSLVEVYRLELESEGIPLVVNTMGWTKGLGADLCARVEDIVQPQRIFDFGDEAAGLAVSPTLHHSAADHRTLSILSYLYFLPQAGIWDISLPLCAKPPHEVDIRAAFDRIYLSHEDVVPDELPRVLNGALVGLATDSLSDSGGLYVQGAPLPQAKCHGLALVRYCNPSTMHIITPVPPPSDARVLVKGDMELPVWGFLDWRSDEEKETPYLQWGRGEGLGAEKRRVRRNLMRKSQM